MIVVLFKNEMKSGVSSAEYEALGARMYEIASSIPGFVSLESYPTENGELAIVTFESEAALTAWREHPEHREAQRRGREQFYRSYQIRVCELQREYGFQDGAETP
jgi:heme-degrading monooxygenase HmoA